MFKKLLLFASVVLMIAMVSCKGDDGAVGPAGAAGAQGPAGAAGPKGDKGEDGASSSAIILSTGAVDTDSTGGFITGRENLTPAEDSAFSSSVVLVYLKASNVYWPMPGVISFGGGKVSSFTFVHAVQDKTFFVELLPTDWSENQTTAPKRTFQDIRIIIVPGEIVSGGRLSAEILKDYNKTIAALGLTDTQVKTAGKLKLSLKRK
ncbi:hypothetical protein GCM10007423_45610 [Dyadobacter endophyticus]|uniref:Collagen-like protein n=1 Tax=Dyadobacter endophyticus TaxID=1749036 RepID=A0ABQ1Z0X7_9BACT|nr:hypothetical protein [Dyadobacter endophyticus]GGH46123.1 hypothetical protein GCM10007423_45610 [Dyadobacter endophyticus]